MSGISVQHLNKAYASFQVLRDIDFRVSAGEFVVLLGPSGCGKSTLLNVIAGLDEVDSGRVLIGDTDVTGFEPNQRGLAMVFQSYALYPTMTVRRNLSFGLRVNKVAKPEVERRVAWAANLLQLTPMLDRLPSQLSGGQRQRVAIGRALVRQVPVYLFDEPLSNLDARLRTEMRVEIKRLHQELGCTIVYVTHDQVEAMTLATRIAVMKDGKIEQFADPATVYDRPASLFVASFVGSPAMNFIEGRLHGEAAGPVFRSGDLILPLEPGVFAAPPPEELDVVLGIRPEDIVIAPGAGPGPTFSAALVFIEPMGADTFAWFDHAGGRLSVRLSPTLARGLAGAATLAPDLAKASIFDAATGRRL
ncbi:MAG: ABC transporter ATP-binding protein [Azospirillaceae bacterium]|nr:ABC transporter ATP-binding protein [Azospirillaceae bacterium]